jgi:hypothetical protein
MTTFFATPCGNLFARVRSPNAGSFAPWPGSNVDSPGSLVVTPGSFAGFSGEM